MLKFAAEGKKNRLGLAEKKDWIVLVADDDEEVHSTTRRILKSFSYKGRGIQLLHAYSAKETEKLVARTPDVALILLDVVMETTDSGLLVVDHIRGKLKNDIVQIVLRTGQPGHAPEHKAVVDYMINDYLNKNELTVQRILNVVIISLRAFNLTYTLQCEVGERKLAEQQLREYREGLERLVDKRTDELKKANIALEGAVREAEDANRAKSGFLNAMSHEFRTPMHGILSFASFGIKKYSIANRETILRYFTKIDASARRLLKLVNDLLDLAKLEAGRVVYEIERVRLSDIVRDAIGELDAYADELAVSVTFVEPGFDDTVEVDSAKISQVIVNLLSNAVKFSKAGEEVQLKLAEDGNLIVLAVKDAGIGIPEKEREGIFKKFVQGSKTKSFVQGTGLGLPICKRIVEDHNGKIWVEEGTPKGSIFKFSIPKRKDLR